MKTLAEYRAGAAAREAAHAAELLRPRFPPGAGLLSYPARCPSCRALLLVAAWKSGRWLVCYGCGWDTLEVSEPGIDPSGVAGR